MSKADPLVIPLQEWTRGAVDSEQVVSEPGDGLSRSTSTSLNLAAIFAGTGKMSQDGRKSPSPPSVPHTPRPSDRHGTWEHQCECERHCEYEYTVKGSKTRQGDCTRNVQHHGQRRRRVLVVDDDELNRCITADILRDSDPENGWALDVDAAVDGLEALELLHSQQYNCVVTDINMPKLDGRGLAQKVREAALGVPVVGMTGCAAATDIQTSLDSGMVACLPKPVDLHTLIRTVRQVIV